MKKVIYQGPADIRILTSDDVQQAGVEAGVFKKTEFFRNESVEVEDSVATALIENPDVFGKFAIHEEVAEAETADAPEVEAGEPTSTGSHSTSEGSPSGAAKSVRGSTSKS